MLQTVRSAKSGLVRSSKVYRPSWSRERKRNPLHTAVCGLPCGERGPAGLAALEHTRSDRWRRALPLIVPPPRKLDGYGYGSSGDHHLRPRPQALKPLGVEVDAAEGGRDVHGTAPTVHRAPGTNADQR